MKRIRRISLSMAAIVLLASCTGADTPEDTPLTTLAVDAAEETIYLTNELTNELQARPVAQLGMYVTHYLLFRRNVSSALDAVYEHTAFLRDPLTRDESFVILQNLAASMQVDVNDMLDRSVNRSEAFTVYVQTLGQLLREANAERERLEQEMDDITDERRAKRSTTSDIQRTLNTALREQDYATASDAQQELIAAEGDLAEVEAKQDEVRSIIRLFEDVIEAGEKRAIAMEENREVILAGLMVVDVPGIDDLGILKQENSRFFRNARSIFDPGSF